MKQPTGDFVTDLLSGGGLTDIQFFIFVMCVFMSAVEFGVILRFIAG